MGRESRAERKVLTNDTSFMVAGRQGSDRD